MVCQTDGLGSFDHIGRIRCGPPNRYLGREEHAVPDVRDNSEEGTTKDPWRGRCEGRLEPEKRDREV